MNTFSYYSYVPWNIHTLYKSLLVCYSNELTVQTNRDNPCSSPEYEIKNLVRMRVFSLVYAHVVRVLNGIYLPISVIYAHGGLMRFPLVGDWKGRTEEETRRDPEWWVMYGA